jgi:uncharacterized protein YciI
MAEYLYLIHPYRHGFYETPTVEEKVLLEEHFTYLKRAAEVGIVLLAGPCKDDTFGLVVFLAESDSAANAFMFADPGVKKNLMVAELHPLHITIRAK